LPGANPPGGKQNWKNERHWYPDIWWWERKKMKRMWEIFGLLWGFKQRRNWGENYYSCTIYRMHNGNDHVQGNKFKKELILLDAATAFSALPSG
jgi:hypothetical protein